MFDKMFQAKGSDISAQKFVDQLLDEGAKISCDKTNQSFLERNELPDYYDEELYKQGQKLYYNHYYALNLTHTLGTAAIYSIPSIYNVAKIAAENATIFQNFKRQLNVFLILYMFYQQNLEPGSKLLNYVSRIKNRHNAVSTDSVNKGLNPLTQKDMALVQFIFVGLTMIGGPAIGFHGVTDEEWRGHHHFWRVIGYLVGIEERFNMCSVPLEKTLEICELLMEQHFRPEMDKKEIFLNVGLYSFHSFLPIVPELQPKCGLNHIYNLIKTKEERAKFPEPTYLKMNIVLRTYYKMFCFQQLYLMKWSFYRSFKNLVCRLQHYLISRFSIVPKIWLTIGNYI